MTYPVDKNHKTIAKSNLKNRFFRLSLETIRFISSLITLKGKG